MPEESQQLETFFPFMRLPTELRLHVYSFLLLNTPKEMPAQFNRAGRRRPSWDQPNDEYIPLREDGDSCHMAILCVRKQIYDEAIDMIHSSLAFAANISNCITLCNRYWRSGRSRSTGYTDYKNLLHLVDHIKTLHIVLDMPRIVHMREAHERSNPSSFQLSLHWLLFALKRSTKLKRLVVEFDWQNGKRERRRHRRRYEDRTQPLENEEWISSLLRPFDLFRTLEQAKFRLIKSKFDFALPLKEYLHALEKLMCSEEDTSSITPEMDLWYEFHKWFVAHFHSEPALPPRLKAEFRKARLACRDGNTIAFYEAKQVISDFREQNKDCALEFMIRRKERPQPIAPPASPYHHTIFSQEAIKFSYWSNHCMQTGHSVFTIPKDRSRSSKKSTKHNSTLVSVMQITNSVIPMLFRHTSPK